MIQQAIPLFHVTNAARSRDFYRDALGFRVSFAHPEDAADPAYLGLERDGVALHLSSHAEDGVVGSVVYLLVDDVDALHRELLARDVAIALHPFDQTWGMREMYVRDPDGNAVRFGQPVAG